MANEKKFLDLLGTSYLKDKIIEYLKDYTDTQVLEVVSQYQSIYDFPSVGNKNKIYIDKSTNSIYRWDDEAVKYYCVGSDYNSIEVINGGDSGV